MHLSLTHPDSRHLTDYSSKIEMIRLPPWIHWHSWYAAASSASPLELCYGMMMVTILLKIWCTFSFQNSSIDYGTFIVLKNLISIACDGHVTIMWRPCDGHVTLNRNQKSSKEFQIDVFILFVNCDGGNCLDMYVGILGTIVFLLLSLYDDDYSILIWLRTIQTADLFSLNASATAEFFERRRLSLGQKWIMLA